MLTILFSNKRSYMCDLVRLNCITYPVIQLSTLSSFHNFFKKLQVDLHDPEYFFFLIGQKSAQALSVPVFLVFTSEYSKLFT